MLNVLIINVCIIKDEQWSRYLEYLIRHDNGKPFRDVLQNDTSVERLITMALSLSNNLITLPTGEFCLSLPYLSE